jgi:hypothetical protein
MGALWPELFGTRYLGEIRALTFAGAVLASALAPLATGYLIDQGVAFPLQMTVMGALSLFACAAYLMMQGRLAAIVSTQRKTAQAIRSKIGYECEHGRRDQTLDSEA